MPQNVVNAFARHDALAEAITSTYNSMYMLHAEHIQLHYVTYKLDMVGYFYSSGIRSNVQSVIR